MQGAASWLARLSEWGAGLRGADRQGLVLGVCPFEGRRARLGARAGGLKCSGRGFESFARGALGVARQAFWLGVRGSSARCARLLNSVYALFRGVCGSLSLAGREKGPAAENWTAVGKGGLGE